MNELKKAPASMLKFSGTPIEIGGQIWERMCLPAVAKVGTDMPAVALGQLYAGFTLAAWGAMVADFGHEQAVYFAKQMLESFEQTAETLVDDGSSGKH
jgi:hypothetical protein